MYNDSHQQETLIHNTTKGEIKMTEDEIELKIKDIQVLFIK
jgi:hypothetical protein